MPLRVNIPLPWPRSCPAASKRCASARRSRPLAWTAWAAPAAPRGGRPGRCRKRRRREEWAVGRGQEETRRGGEVRRRV